MPGAQAVYSSCLFNAAPKQSPGPWQSTAMPQQSRLRLGASRPQCRLWVLFFAMLAAAQAEAAAKCKVFSPTGCWFQVPSKGPLSLPRCGQEPCDFDQSVLECPFFSSGTYKTVDADDCEPFMRDGTQEQPSCGEACCTGLVPGDFVSHADDKAARDYVPFEMAGCKYHEYRRHEVMERLLGGSTDIVVAGDSMMRQFYLRLVQQLRGQRRLFDYRVHTHAKYSHCEEADTFETAEYMDNMKQPGKDYLLNSIPEFFTPLSDPLPAALAACSRAPSRIDFLHAPLFTYQMDVLRRYVETMRQPGRELIIVTYIGVWTKAGNVPMKYLALLEELLPEMLLVTVSIPTFREQRHPDVCVKYLERNKKMAAWAAKHPGRVMVLDFNGMSLAANTPPTTINWDKHYMCYVTYPREEKEAEVRKALMAANGLRERAFQNPVGDIWYTTDGQCYDEMNRNLWLVLLNAIMQTVDGAWPLPDSSGRNSSSSRSSSSSSTSTSTSTHSDEVPTLW